MNAENFIEEIDSFSKYRLKRKDDLKTIIEICINNEKLQLLEDLSFTSKYIRGLERVLKKGRMNPEISNLEQIKQDYMNNVNKSVEQLKEIISMADSNIKNYFEETYLKLTQTGFKNLGELQEDLEWTKMYLNNQKRQNSN